MFWKKVLLEVEPGAAEVWEGAPVTVSKTVEGLGERPMLEVGEELEMEEDEREDEEEDEEEDEREEEEEEELAVVAEELEALLDGFG